MLLRVDLIPVDGNTINTTKTNETADDAAANASRAVCHTGLLTHVTRADLTSHDCCDRTADTSKQTERQASVKNTQAVNEYQTQTDRKVTTGDRTAFAHQAGGEWTPTYQLNGQSRYHSDTSPGGNGKAVGDMDGDRLCDNEFMRLSAMFLTKPDKSELDPSSRETSQQAEKFKLAQANDPTLTHWRKLEERGSNRFMIADGILFKRKAHQVLSDNEWVLCLPAEFRDKALRTAHDSLDAGGTHHTDEL